MRPLAGLTARSVGRDLLAGVTLLAIAVPLNIGYAQIAGLPPTAGLYALIVPTIIFVAVTSSRHVVASPDAAAAALVASSVGGLAVAGSDQYLVMAMAQAIISGIAFVVMAVFRLGFLANFLSAPILVGFVAGLALDILVSQIAKMLGVPIESGSEFLEKLGQLATGLPQTNVWALCISVGSLMILLVGRRWVRVAPWALVVIVVSTAVVAITGADQAGVDVLGEVTGGMPSVTWPILDWGTWIALVPSALALTLVTVAEGLLLSRSYGERHRYRTEPNRDLLAFGLTNIAAGASGSFAIGSSTSRSAAMEQAGARSQLPSIVTAAGTLLLLLFGTSALALIPSPAIGAVVAVAILPLLGIRELTRLWRVERGEFVVAAVCFAVTLLVGTIAGIAVAFVLALITVTRRAAAAPVDVLAAGEDGGAILETAGPGTLTAPGVLILRLSAPLFFANAASFVGAVKASVEAADAPVHHVVIDLESVTDADVTAAEALTGLRGWLTERGIRLAFSRPREHLLPRLGRLGIIAGELVFATNREAADSLSAAGPSEGPSATTPDASSPAGETSP
ncbi:SulP family inorganic anion transporter [Microbacterium schleiferi]|uniref:SulP family inorganic anion transporter n=1 Tax=Microbacterium schleiferi TaxID=69362 RepID=A0A7S8N0B2_9MICO|nr:SulP family inorganic anion transporter [Microbacterium schleiferi]